jgi:hypothetical protein
MNDHEIHTYGGYKYRRRGTGWERRMHGTIAWYTLNRTSGKVETVEMLDALHPLPDPPPVTVTLDGETWTKEDDTRWRTGGTRGSYSLQLALDRIVELGGQDR